MSVPNVTYDGVEIGQSGRLSFSGSSSPSVQDFPKTVGSLIKEASESSRIINVHTFFTLANQTKTELEDLQHQLHELLANIKKADLVINGNIYQDVVPTSNSFELLTHNEYIEYIINFELDFDQGFFNSQINGNKLRRGIFSYTDQNEVGDNINVEFQILNNFEAAHSVSYDLKSDIRKIRSFGAEKNLSGGVETINLDCFLIEDKIRHMENYLSNYLLGPLGRKGTLDLNGNEYEEAILIGVTSDQAVGSSKKYKLTFIVSLKC